MEYKNLGRTGLKVSPLCLGTMNFGPQTGEEDSFAIMDKALGVGINFFDVDRSTPWEEIWQAMEQLVREGKILYVGSSNFAGMHIVQGTMEQFEGNLHSLEIELSEDVLAKLDEIWPGPGGEAPEAYAW